ncbi:MAG: hypothetical protein WBP45_08400 [Daejeonella sp.]
MLKISTQTSSSLENETSQKSFALNDEEQFFYNSIKDDLNRIIKEPCPDTVNKILNFSKSL